MQTFRWFLSDTWSQLVYGEHKGCVREGRDVGGLLAALQGVYSMSAKAAVMPWLMPLLRHPWWRRWVWARTKTFKCMDVLYSVGLIATFYEELGPGGYHGGAD